MNNKNEGELLRKSLCVFEFDTIPFHVFSKQTNQLRYMN